MNKHDHVQIKQEEIHSWQQNSCLSQVQDVCELSDDHNAQGLLTAASAAYSWGSSALGTAPSLQQFPACCHPRAALSATAAR